MRESTWLAVLDRASALGQRVLSDGTRLIGPAPHVGRAAWLHIIFRALEEREIGGLREKLDNLPEAFRGFLARQNGLSIFSDALSIYGLRVSYARTGDAAYQPYSILTPNVHERPRDAPSSAFFVGGYSGDGSLLYIDEAENGRVIRCDRETAASLNCWTNMTAMLDSEALRLAFLYDAQGRCIDPNRPTTPEPETVH